MLAARPISARRLVRKQSQRNAVNLYTAVGTPWDVAGAIRFSDTRDLLLNERDKIV
jgi:hypothetical protein